MEFTVNRLLEKLNKEIEKLEYGKEPEELYTPISYIMSMGGKRMRPLLTLLSANLFTDNLEKVYKPAIAVELFHNFTLMHDDIMDNAPIRRGQPTVHHKWNNSVAILSGDVMLVKTYELFANLDDSILKKALALFNECASRVCEGQQLDMNFENRENVSEAEYIHMIRLKTAELLGFSLELGGMIAGAGEEDLKHLKEFGINTGIGFQLMDDLLDVYGDHKKFGKKVGGDIEANKKTFLTIKAFELAKDAPLSKLKAYYSKKAGNTEQKIKEVTAIYDALDIKKLTEDKINAYFSKGFKSLSRINAPLYKKAILKGLTQSLMSREN